MTTATTNRGPARQPQKTLSETAPPPQTTIDGPEDDLLDQAILVTAARLDRLGERCRSAVEGAEGHMQRAMLLAAGMDKLRRAITPDVLRLAKSLMNTDLGFQTDRGPGKRQEAPYSDETIKDCLVAAAVHGLYWTGNEFNIVAGKCYITQMGYDRKFRSIPDISDVVIAPGVPVLHQGRQVVRVAVSWALGGVKDQLVGPDGKPGMPFPITSYGKESADQLIGKAKRKAWKAAFEKATGSSHLLPPDGEAGEAPDGPAFSRTEQVLDQLRTNSRDAEQLKKIKDLAAGMAPDEFAALAESCGQADPLQMTAEQRDALLLQLEAQAREAAEVEQREREALAAE